MRLRLLLSGVAIAVLFAAGCSTSDRPAYPVEFTVQVQGKPAVGATVVLHPVAKTDGKTPLPTGKVDPTGTVRLSTFAQDDGAPPGDYTVTVEWRDQVVVTVGSDKLTEFTADKLKGKYSKPTAPAAPRVAVKKEANKPAPLQL